MREGIFVVCLHSLFYFGFSGEATVEVSGLKRRPALQWTLGAGLGTGWQLGSRYLLEFL